MLLKITNQAMQRLLDSSKVDDIFINEQLKELEPWLNSPSFYEIDGFILMDINGLLDVSKKINMEIIVKRFGDKLGYEAVKNKIHLNDYLPQLDMNECIHIAAALLEMWGEKLHSQFPDYFFHLLLGYGEEDGEIVSRIYRLRYDEEPWLDVNTLDEFPQAILFVEIDRK